MEHNIPQLFSVQGTIVFIHRGSKGLANTTTEDRILARQFVCYVVR
jgi:hypothetical protein